MKILQIIPSLGRGGAEQLVIDLSNELSHANIVHLVTFYDIDANITNRKLFSNTINVTSLGKKYGFDYKIIYRLYKIIKEVKPDIIHTHLGSINYLLLLVLFFRNISFFHTVHNDAFMECKNLFLRLIRGLFYRSNKILAVTISEESRKSFNKAYYNANNSLIFNGRVNPDKSTEFESVNKMIHLYKTTLDSKIFVTIGRLETQKNQIMLVNAFKKLTILYPNITLLIIGGARNSETSKKIEDQLNAAVKNSKNIKLIGEIANATDYLHLADYFCLSSIHEGMPITLIEAFACECIPICTPVGGMKEMIDKVDVNLLSKSLAVDDYFEALKYAFELEDKKKEQIKKILKQIFREQYSIERCAENYMLLYKESVN